MPGAWALIKAGDWELPVVFTQEGDRLRGEVSLMCEVDLNNSSIDQAKADIAMMMKSAIATRIGA